MMSTQSRNAPVPPAPVADLPSLTAEVCEQARRRDSTAKLIELSAAQLGGWQQEYDPKRKSSLRGFIAMRLGDQLIVHLLGTEGTEAAATAAIYLHTSQIGIMAARMAAEHGLTSADADDIAVSGQRAIFALMAKYDPRVCSSFHGYAFGRSQNPSLVRLAMLRDLCESYFHLSDYEYRCARLCRKAVEDFCKAEEDERQPTPEELLPLLGVKKIKTAANCLLWKHIAFNQLAGCQGPNEQDDDWNGDDRGAYGEWDAYCSEDKSNACAGVYLGLRLLEARNPLWADCIRQKCGMPPKSSDFEAWRQAKSAMAYRQALCRGRALATAVLRLVKRNAPKPKIAALLHLDTRTVETVYAECVGF
jgi:hypothetical protein